MSILGKILGSPVPAATDPDTMVELTNFGRSETNNLAPDDVEFPFMSALYRRAMSLEDLSHEAHFSLSVTDHEVKKLIKKGYVKKVDK